MYIEGRTERFGGDEVGAARAGEITADILLDSVEVNDIPAPPLRLASRWDFAAQPRRSDGLRPLSGATR